MDDPYVARRIRLLLEAIPHKSDTELAALATADEATVAKLRAEAVAAELEIQEWLVIRKEAGRHIDPENAEVFLEHGQILDPYGIGRVPEGGDCIGRNYFARAPGSDIWVSFHDLPHATVDRLHERMKSGHVRSPVEDLPF